MTVQCNGHNHLNCKQIYCTTIVPVLFLVEYEIDTKE